MEGLILPNPKINMGADWGFFCRLPPALGALREGAWFWTLPPPSLMNPVRFAPSSPTPRTHSLWSCLSFTLFLSSPFSFTRIDGVTTVWQVSPKPVVGSCGPSPDFSASREQPHSWALEIEPHIEGS